MLIYKLFQTQSMLLSATSRKGQLNADLQPVQNPEHDLVSNKCQAERASQMLTYILFKAQSMLFSATSRKGQPDPDLHPVQSPEHALISNKQERPSRCSLTSCSNPRALACHQQQAGKAIQMLTYKLFKSQSIGMSSATSRKGQPHADLQAVQNTEHNLVSNKQEGPPRS